MIKHAIVGTGGMANVHAEQMGNIPGVNVSCACDIDSERVTAFCAKHKIPNHYTDYAKMLEEGDFSSISIVTPDATHAPLTLQAIEAGKHVLCEKPLATSVADADKMAAAAQDARLINIVNFSYRHSSAWQRAMQMVRNGELGRIYHFQAHYLQSWLSSKDWGDWKTSPNWLWRLSTEHGSNGALGDVGVHILDFATGPIGKTENLYCLLKTFDKAPDNKIGEYTLDANDSALITLQCENGAIGTLAITRWATGHQNSLALSIHGDKAAIRLDLDRSYSMLDVCHVAEDGHTQPWESIYCGKTPGNFERFVESMRSGKQDQPDFARGAEVQRMLEACNRSADQQALVRCQ